MKPKLKIDVNSNQTKKGIKIQFIMPNNVSPEQKEIYTAKLKTKLNAGLADHNLSVDTDLDIPYENVIGFLIRIESIKMLIKNILVGDNGLTGDSGNGGGDVAADDNFGGGGEEEIGATSNNLPQ